MRRPVIALLAACLGVLSLAAPASAGATTALLVGRDDGSVSTQRVPVATAAAAAEAIQSEPGVRFASLDLPVSVAAVTPNDTRYPQQWGPPKVRAPEAWARTTGDSNVVVAVIDTGVEATHPDLVGSVLPGHDFVDNDDDPADANGHGTMVAGVVAARGNNGIGVAGYCWQCKILPVRGLDANGSGQSGQVALGIFYAVDHGADIINLSLTVSGYDPGMAAAVSYAIAHGVLVVAASGNDGVDVVHYPAGFPGVISVGASDEADQRASFSNYGSWVEVVAPGVNITSTATGSRYVLNVNGTSFASPAVAGILGLALSAFPTVAPSAVRDALFASSVASAGGPSAHGRVDAAALLDALAATQVTVTRVSGTDPARTSVAVSAGLRSSAPAAVLARAEDFADALTAGPLAAKVGGPLLLTPGATLDDTVLGELRRLGVATVYLVGGTTALSPAIEATLSSAGIGAVRVAGATRYETATTIARMIGGTSVYVASATSWADAVGVSALAGSQGRPILLTGATALPAATTAGLAGVRDATVVGGTAVVGDGVLGALRARGIATTRLAGTSRYLTSALVADATLAAGVAPARTWLATGLDWRDALVAGPAAAANGGVLLLIDGGRLDGSAASAWLSARGGAVRELHIVGTESSVTAAVLAGLKSLLG